MMAGVFAVEWRMRSGVAIVGLSAPSKFEVTDGRIPARSVSDALPIVASASRRLIAASFLVPGFGFASFGFTSKLKIRNSKLLILQQLPQHVLQNPSMPIVIQFRRCIDTAEDLELGDLAVITGRLYGEFLSQLESGRDASDIELLESRQSEGL